MLQVSLQEAEAFVVELNGFVSELGVADANGGGGRNPFLEHRVVADIEYLGACIELSYRVLIPACEGSNPSSPAIFKEG